MDDYDDVRKCCQGKSICDVCWDLFIVPAVGVLHSVLIDVYQYKVTLWTFSGGRGIHVRVFDDEARRLDSQ